MAGEGQILRDARVQKGWSIVQAEEVTKIRVRYLEALEAENYSILPGSTYVKGFLRTYAKHLGLNPEEIMDRYKSSEVIKVQPEMESVINIPRKRSNWLKPVVLVLTGLFALAIVIGIANLSKPEGKDKVSDFTPAPLPSAPPIETQPKESINPSESPSQPQSTVLTPSSVSAEEIEGLKVQLVFTEKCWIVVNVDGQPALRGTFPEGTTKELTAKEKIELVEVGNAGGVAITVNGRPYPSLGQSGQVVRNVVLTKEAVNQVSLNP